MSSRWTTLVPRELTHGPHSFGGLRERLPRISAKVLTERLRVLEQPGLVAHDRLNGFPAHSRYRLTAAAERPCAPCSSSPAGRVRLRAPRKAKPAPPTRST
ncbi:winged helix-turn-helix transcriptional regulator [Streptomyces sp. 24-1644]|uniref:winged helix-turn-helix transcriptional regulator n=1 Tax=Streptomyces sp. 24-1644 TaxID=3457315 RepID=UPI003FA7940C